MAKIREEQRSGYHSLATRYFKKVKGLKPEAPAPKIPETNWNHIRHLCAKEQYARAVEAGEDRLSPDWEPPCDDSES